MQSKLPTGTTTFANLPPASGFPPATGLYTSAYTTDQGVVYSDGDSWLPLGSNTSANTVILVTGSRIATNSDNGKTLKFTGPWTLTYPDGLMDSFGNNFIAPASGSAAIAKSGSVTLNGAGITLTRSRANNPFLFAIQALGSDEPNAYLVAGF